MPAALVAGRRCSSLLQAAGADRAVGRSVGAVSAGVVPAGRSRSDRLRAARHQLPAGRRGVDRVRVDSNRGPLVEYRDAELQPSHHPAGIAQRSSRRRRSSARHARGDQFLDSAARRRIVPASISHVVELTVQRPDGVETVTVSGGAAAGDHRAGDRARRAAAAADRGSRSTIRCSRAGIAPRSTPSTAAPAFPAASRSTSSSCRLAARWLADPKARPATGNGLGADVLAVADGTIATAVDGMR